MAGPKRYREPTNFRVNDPGMGGPAAAMRSATAKLGNFVSNVIEVKQEEKRRAQREAEAVQAQKDEAAGQLAGAELAMQPLPSVGPGQELKPATITGSKAYQRAAISSFLSIASLENDRAIAELEIANQNNIAGFDAGLAELRKKRLEGIPEQAVPYLHFDLIKQANVARTRIQIGQLKAKDKEATDALGLVSDSSLAAANSAARLGDQTGAVEHNRQKFDASLNELELKGKINAVDRQKALAGFDAEVTISRTMGEVERATEFGGPEAGQAVLDAVPKDKLPIEVYDKIQTQGAAMISREKTGAARSQGTSSAAAGVASMAAINNARNTIDQLTVGIVPEDIDKTAAGVAGTDLGPVLRESIAAAPRMATFVQLGPQGMDLAIAQMREKAAAAPDAGTLREIGRMQAARDKVVGAMQSDPLGFAISVGVVPALGGPDITKPQDLQDRARWALTATQYFKTDVPPFTLEESNKLGFDFMSLGAASQRQALNTLVDNVGPVMAAAALGQFHELNYSVLSGAGGQLLDGTSKGQQVAGLILEGAELMRNKDLASRIMPPEKDLTLAIDAELGSAFEYVADARIQFTDNIRQAYAALSFRAGKYGDQAVDPERLKKAMRAVLGGDLIVAGTSEFPPPARDVTQKQFDTWRERLTDGDIAAMGPLPAGYSAEKMLELVQGEGRLVDAGQGEWVVEVESLLPDHINGGRQMRLLQRPDGSKWRLRWTGGSAGAKSSTIFQKAAKVVGPAVQSNPLAPIGRDTLEAGAKRADQLVDEGF